MGRTRKPKPKKRASLYLDEQNLASINKIREHMERNMPGVPITNTMVLFYALRFTADSLLPHEGEIS